MRANKEKTIALQMLRADNDNIGGKPPRGPRPVEQLTDQELQNIVENFARKGVVVSPWHRLIDVKFEIFSRKMKGVDGGLVTGIILGLVASSPTARITYDQLNCAIFAENINGPGAVGRLMLYLGSALAYCVKHQMPIASALVTRRDGTYSEKALNNLFDAAKYLGAAGDVDPAKYVQEQAEQAAALVKHRSYQVAA